MKILTIHADFIEFEPRTKAFKGAEEGVAKGKQRVNECLVVFTAVEKADEKNIQETVKRYVSEVKSVAEQVKTKTIVLYPYAHLSSTLAAPGPALEVMKQAEKELHKEFSVTRAPFGWYKAFDISCKGHPLSELSREFVVGESSEKPTQESQALKAEKKLVSHWYILDTAGKLQAIAKGEKGVTGFDFSKHPKLEKFASYEIAKVRAVTEEPPHVKYMKKLELVDYEPGSDPGNLRYYPKGRLIKSLLERFVTMKMKQAGAMEMESPIMYDFEHPSLKSYLNRFPARQYTIQTPNKQVFLRFAACFGQFLMAHDSQISYKDLPVWLYELTRYSFRVEQHGELTGLRRLRAFTMPDCHAFVADVAMARKEMERRFQLAWEVQTACGIDPQTDLEFGIRVTQDFYNQNKDFIHQLVKKWGKPALVEMWDERFFYYMMKYEWNFVDNLDKATALTTDQIDVENAERYGITYIGKDGRKANPLILHLSPSGAIERVMYALLEKAGFDEKAGKLPTLPLWLCPTQVRLIPLSMEHHGTFCEKLAGEFEKQNIRVDIDDRAESVGKRIRTAALEWIPYTLVIGEKEIKGKIVTVRDRYQDTEKEMTLKQLLNTISEQTSGRPTDTLALPKYLSKRVVFVG